MRCPPAICDDHRRCSVLAAMRQLKNRHRAGPIPWRCSRSSTPEAELVQMRGLHAQRNTVDPWGQSSFPNCLTYKRTLVLYMIWGPSRHLGSLTAANWMSFDFNVSYSSCWGYSLINTLKLKNIWFAHMSMLDFKLVCWREVANMVYFPVDDTVRIP